MPRKISPSGKLEPSRHLLDALDHVDTAVRVALDVGCGIGRNSFLLARAGFTTFAADNDERRLAMLGSFDSGRSLIDRGELLPVRADMDSGQLPFPDRMFGLVILIHYLPPHLRAVADLVAPGGYLFVETINGHGGNWLELPPSGRLRSLLQRDFTFLDYRERQVGKNGANAVTIRLFARRCEEAHRSR